MIATRDVIFNPQQGLAIYSRREDAYITYLSSRAYIVIGIFLEPHDSNHVVGCQSDDDSNR